MSNSIDNLIKKNSIKEKKFKCSHPGCDKSFARVDYLLRHKGNHSEVKPFNCRQCQAGFARKDLLIKHFKSKSHQKRKADIPCKYNDQITNDLEANSSIGNKVVSKEFKETSSFDYGTDSSLNTSSKNLSLRNIFNPMQNASDTLGLENISHSKMEEKNQNHLFNQGIDTESSGIHQKATPPNAFSEYRDNYGWLFGNLNNLEFEPDKLFFESLSPVLSTMNREQANLNNFNLLSEETRFQILQLLNLDDLNSLLIEDFDDFLKLYWNEFNSIYPIIHFPTFDPSKTNIYLLVSMLNIGMAYSKYTCHYKISLLVHDSLRKLLLYEVNNFEDNLELSIFQALLLNNYFGKYCGTDLQLKKSILFHGLNINLLKSLRFLEGLVEPAVSDKSSWNDWILYETSKRTAFFAYICDSQHAALFNLDQHLSIFEINLELPCTDNVWNASDLNEFFEQYDLQPKNLNPRKKPSIELNDANSNTPLLSSIKIETRWPNFLFSLRRLLQPYKETHKEYQMNCFSQYSRFISLHGLLNICYDLKYRGLFDLGILTKKRLFDLVIRLQHAFLSWKDYFDRHISITNRSECDEVLNDYSASPIFWSNLTIFKIALISLYVDTSTILKYSSNLNDHKLITKIQNWTKSSEGESCVIESCRFLIIVINNVEIIHSVPHVAYCTFLVCLILWSFETNRQISAFNSTNMLTPLTPRKYFDADNNLLIETVGNDATNYLSGILENNNINVENFEEYCTRQQQVIALITYIIGILKENCSWENIGPRIEVLEKVLKTYDE